MGQRTENVLLFWLCFQMSCTRSALNATIDGLNTTQLSTAAPGHSSFGFALTPPALGDTVLYVRKDGCDYGYCTSPFSNYTDVCLYQPDQFTRAIERCCFSQNPTSAEISTTEFADTDPYSSLVLDFSTTSMPTTRQRRRLLNAPSLEPTLEPTIHPTSEPTLEPTVGITTTRESVSCYLLHVSVLPDTVAPLSFNADDFQGSYYLMQDVAAAFDKSIWRSERGTYIHYTRSGHWRINGLLSHESDGVAPEADAWWTFDDASAAVDMDGEIHVRVDCLTTDFPTLQPTQSPTLPTAPPSTSHTLAVPTAAPTYAVWPSRPCSANQSVCIDVDMQPSFYALTRYEVLVQATWTGEHQQIDVVFNITNGVDCVTPSISFEYELIDYETSSRYIEILNHGEWFAQCGGSVQTPTHCTSFVDCFSPAQVRMPTIIANDTFNLSVIVSANVDALCNIAYFDSNPYVVNALLALECQAGTAAPTQEPTAAPTYPVWPSEVCGTNRLCIDVSVRPSLEVATSYDVHIQAKDTNAEQQFDVLFTSENGMDCVDPAVSFMFERIDYDAEHEHISIYVGDEFLAQCGGGSSIACYSFEQCLNSTSIGLTKLSAVRLSIVMSSTVDPLCSGQSGHDHVINAVLTLECSTGIGVPTTEPTLPSPSAAPTAAPIYPIWPQRACGAFDWIDNATCIDVSIEPSLEAVTRWEVPIQHVETGVDLQIDVLFTVGNGMECVSPTLSFTFELIDNDGGSEWIEVHMNGEYWGDCGAGGSATPAVCDTFDECLSSYPIGLAALSASQPFNVSLVVSSSVNAYCDHPYAINAVLTLQCDSGTSVPTVAPTSPPTYPDWARYDCGVNRVCWDMSIRPSFNATTNWPVPIQYAETGALQQFDVMFSIENSAADCVAPSLSFTYETIDYGSSTEYLMILINGKVFAQCGGTRTLLGCESYDTCLSSASLGVSKIEASKMYNISVTMSAEVNSWCSRHDYAINAVLTLECRAGTSAPTTEPTLSPTSHTWPTTPCGPNVWCVDVAVEPAVDSMTNFTVPIQYGELNTLFQYDISFTVSNGETCSAPTLSFVYERIDYDQPHEYLEIYVNGDRFKRCGGSYDLQNVCGVFDTCLDAQLIGAKIAAAQTYQVSVVVSSSVNSLCIDHEFAVNAVLTLTCSGGTAPPTTEPTVQLLSTSHTLPRVQTWWPSFACGPNTTLSDTTCIDVAVQPELDAATYSLVPLVSSYTGQYQEQRFDIMFTIDRGVDCVSPTLSFEYELIDYDEPSKAIEIRTNDEFFVQCGGSSLTPQSLCEYSDWCLWNKPVAVSKISAADTYNVSVIVPAAVQPMCDSYYQHFYQTSHDYIIYALLWLDCAAGTNAPTLGPTAAPTNPSLAPSVAPTMTPTHEPTCSSIDYAWNCFQGLGGYPSQSGCDHLGHDGNGVFNLGNGMWDFPFSLLLGNDENIVIRGQGPRETVFNYVGDDWIGCYSAEQSRCWIGLEDLQLASSNESALAFAMSSGGTMHLNNVLFADSNLSRDKWAISHPNVTIIVENTHFVNRKASFVFHVGSSAYFRNCTFVNSPVRFAIRDSAAVQFANCSFVNQTLTDQEMFAVDDGGMLRIIDCSFVNTTVYSTMFSVTNQSSLLISDSSFIGTTQHDELFDLNNNNSSNSGYASSLITAMDSVVVNVTNSFIADSSLSHELVVNGGNASIYFSDLLLVSSYNDVSFMFAGSNNNIHIENCRIVGCDFDGAFVSNVASDQVVVISGLQFTDNDGALFVDAFGIEFIDSNFSTNRLRCCNHVDDDESYVRFERCAFIDNILDSAVLSVRGGTVLLLDTLFGGNRGSDESLLVIEAPAQTGGNATFAMDGNTFLENEFSTLLSCSDNRDIRILITNNNFTSECQNSDEYCITCMNCNLYIDAQSSVQNNNTVLFGHMQENATNAFNNNNSITLHALEFDFNFEAVLNAVEFESFGAENASIIFEPCAAFDPHSFTISEPSWQQSNPSMVVAEVGALVFDTFTCNDTSHNCSSIVCQAQLACSFTTFLFRNQAPLFLHCDAALSCFNDLIRVSASNAVSIICDGEQSCEQSTIELRNVSNAVIECVEVASCAGMRISISDSHNVSIHCYAMSSCKDLDVSSDSDNVDFFFHNFNENVHISLPTKDRLYQQLHCNDDAYIMLNGGHLHNTTAFVFAALDDLFGTAAPCTEIQVDFTDSASPRCTIDYEYNGFFSNQHLPSFMKCIRFRIADVLKMECIGTPSPTPDPTAAPTSEPTPSPTFSPTNAPSLSPSQSPTVSPTGVPSESPTLEPTMIPTSDPTLMPTRALPSNEERFPFHIAVTYQLEHMSARSLALVMNDALSIERIIEQEYHALDNSVAIEYFWIQITPVANADIMSTQSSLRLDADILCIEVVCEDIANINNDDDGQQLSLFQNMTTLRLRRYFEQSASVKAAMHEQLTFSVVSSGSQALSRYPTSVQQIDYQNIALVAAASLVSLIAFAALLYNHGAFPKKCMKKRVDDASWIAVLSFGLQIWDFFSDLNLALFIWAQSDVSNIAILIAGVGTTAFTVIPYLANLLYASRIKQTIRSNEAAKAYFHTKAHVFTVLVVLSGGCYPALALLSSRIFGIEIFNCGLTRYELKQLTRIKVFGTIVLENLPQLVFQILFAAVASSGVSEEVSMSFIASFLSVISTTISFLIDRDSDDVKVNQYYVVCALKTAPRSPLISSLNSSSTDGSQFISQESQRNISKFRGKQKKLASRLAAIYQTQSKNIEVGSTMVTSRGLRTHIVHYVSQNELDALQNEMRKVEIHNVAVDALFMTSNLFEIKRYEIEQLFHEHFSLKEEYEVHYNEYTVAPTEIASSMRSKSLRPAQDYATFVPELNIGEEKDENEQTQAMDPNDDDGLIELQQVVNQGLIGAGAADPTIMSARNVLRLTMSKRKGTETLDVAPSPLRTKSLQTNQFREFRRFKPDRVSSDEEDTESEDSDVAGVPTLMMRETRSKTVNDIHTPASFKE